MNAGPSRSRTLNREGGQPITLVGAGLAGALLAVLLAQRGIEVRVFERNPDPRQGGAPGGRSINLALAARGRHALRRAGLLEAVDAFTLPMGGRMMHSEWGELTRQPYGATEDEVIWSVHRSRLNRLLLDAAEESGRVELNFDHELERVDWPGSELVFKDGKRVPFAVALGTDGAGSALRRAMNGTEDLGVSEELLDHGYLELTVPPTTQATFALDPTALHIWPRGGFMMIALPNDDRSFTGTLFLPRTGDVSFERLGDWLHQEDFFRLHFPDALPLLPRLREDFLEHPVGLLGTVRCRRWHVGGRALVLGDAAHAIVPFHGQGMNAAFEDCVALVDLLAPGLPDSEAGWSHLFERFEAERRPQANAIADMALENYGVMRAAVRDPGFLLRKRLEHELERRHGDRFVPRYSLVMFHRGPYAEAYRRGEIQAEILDRLLDGVGTLEEVDFEAAARMITGRLEPIYTPAD
ncbi:MAG: NAD(P)/FAD-dependent oxidoreductase [Xanthomonadales bacterium]|jgi:kynurenine 3-monooxygenase|nr:NAD(P)/FAD-dependent oxidoreductase [Xanthomonadales bacterium]